MGTISHPPSGNRTSRVLYDAPQSTDLTRPPVGREISSDQGERCEMPGCWWRRWDSNPRPPACKAVKAASVGAGRSAKVQVRAQIGYQPVPSCVPLLPCSRGVFAESAPDPTHQTRLCDNSLGSLARLMRTSHTASHASTPHDAWSSTGFVVVTTQPTRVGPVDMILSRHPAELASPVRNGSAEVTRDRRRSSVVDRAARLADPDCLGEGGVHAAQRHPPSRCVEVEARQH